MSNEVHPGICERKQGSSGEDVTRCSAEVMLIRKFKQKKERCGIKKERERVGGAMNENDRMNGGDQETEKNTRVSPQ